MAVLGITRLDAVNSCLMAINEYRVDALDTNGTSIQADAERVVNESTRYFCAIGWPCNTRKCVAITTTIVGTEDIVRAGFGGLPTNTLRIQGAGPNKNRNFVLRGDTLYDADKGTQDFIAPTTIFLDIAELLDFENCDPILKEEIAQHAAQRFARRKIGSQVTDAYLSQELQISSQFNKTSPIFAGEKQLSQVTNQQPGQ